MERTLISTGSSRQRFGDTLRRLRSYAGYTQAELAHLAEVDRSYISQLEASLKQNVTVDVARQLARALGVPLTVLIGEDASEEPPRDDTAVLKVNRAKTGPLTRLSDYTAEQLVRIERAARLLLLDGTPTPSDVLPEDMVPDDVDEADGAR